jgi:hypothetical protein
MRIYYFVNCAFDGRAGQMRGRLKGIDFIETVAIKSVSYLEIF